MSTPSIEPVAISSLRPTQITISFREVDFKRKTWVDQITNHGKETLNKHIVQVIKGYRGQLYINYQHILVRALYDDGVTDVDTVIVKDLSSLSRESFWLFLDHKQLCHPYNIHGCRVNFNDIPKSIDKLENDIFRSLVAELRRTGEISKIISEYDEFLWADYLRNHLRTQDVIDNFNQQLGLSTILARGKDANYLPGWAGPR